MRGGMINVKIGNRFPNTKYLMGVLRMHDDDL